MANTFSQIHLHFVFAVKHRTGLIQSTWKDELYKYITGIVQTHQHKLIAINGMPDHVHIFIGMRPTQSVSELLQDIKGSSSKWINDRKLVKGKFEWQEGYGAFSYSKSQAKDVVAYIANQELHHQKKTFREEYVEFLQKIEIDFDEKYIFKEPS
jgi:REP element-mobilizing transposase RayT